MERELGIKAASPAPTTEAARHDGADRGAAERPSHRLSDRSDWLGGRQRNWFAR
jgi:hypothetical protein